MNENQAYSPGAEHPVDDDANMDGPLPLPRKGQSEAAWMDKSGLIFVHDEDQAKVFETEKAVRVVRSPMYGIDDQSIMGY